MSDLMSRVATAPISWGVCEVPGWGHQLPPERVLTEMRELGFTHTEQGSAGWLPEDPAALLPVLAAHGMSLLAAFVPLVLHDPSATDSALADATAAADLLAATESLFFNTAPVTSPDWAPRRPWSDAELEHVIEMLGRIDELCTERGLTQVLHQHYGCVVETADEVRYVLDRSRVQFVLDTGHLCIGGFDPVEFANEHADRVGLVHLKDLNLAVAARLNAGELTLMEAVQADLFPPLGEGDLRLDEVVEQMERSGYRGWYVIEQDCALTGAPPAPGAGPVRDVATSVAFLRGIFASLSES